MSCGNAPTAAQEATNVTSIAFAFVALRVVAPQTVQGHVTKPAGTSTYPGKRMKSTSIGKSTLCPSYMCLLLPIQRKTPRLSKGSMRKIGLLSGSRSGRTDTEK